VLRVLPSTSDRTATVAMQVTQPKVPTSEITKLGITTKIAEFTQPFPYAYYRVTNIGRAGKYINGTILKPGELFSLNKTVKERTPANGYVKGTVISEGRFREELGGGVSTMTTAVWTAAFYAGMERVEQRAHSFYVSRYTPGLEATVAWGELDLKFRNTSPHGVLITTSVGRDYVTVRMWSTRVYDKIVADIGPRRKVVEHETVYDDKPGCVEQPGEDGFDITVTRLYYKGGKVVKQDSYGTHYNPQEKVVCAS
jgi:vancomycin resistance protein YoaR